MLSYTGRKSGYAPTTTTTTTFAAIRPSFLPLAFMNSHPPFRRTTTNPKFTEVWVRQGDRAMSSVLGRGVGVGVEMKMGMGAGRGREGGDGRQPPRRSMSPGASIVPENEFSGASVSEKNWNPHQLRRSWGQASSP